jgi:hypothetical protein
MTSLKLASLLFFFSFIGLNTCGNSVKDTKIVSIGYHSNDCEDCNVLKSKMKKMNRKFFRTPIAFIKYDHTTARAKVKAEKKLQKFGMLAIAQKEVGLKHVVLYNAKSKEQIARLEFDDSPQILEKKIRDALRSVK